mmetsp:Transcript_101023/g.290720  ORF Transcript_101023/g.290720 Transcript_101023/m.290720 type:complete len:345 (-) Transcript_101023:281-1315(-)
MRNEAKTRPPARATTGPVAKADTDWPTARAELNQPVSFPRSSALKSALSSSQPYATLHTTWFGGGSTTTLASVRIQVGHWGANVSRETANTACEAKRALKCPPHRRTMSGSIVPTTVATTALIIRTADASLTPRSNSRDPGCAPPCSAQALVVPKPSTQTTNHPAQFNSHMDRKPLGKPPCREGVSLNASGHGAAACGVASGAAFPAPHSMRTCGMSRTAINKPMATKANSPPKATTHNRAASLPKPLAMTQRLWLESGSKQSFIAARVGVRSRSWQASSMPSTPKTKKTAMLREAKGTRMGKEIKPSAAVPPRSSTKGLRPYLSERWPSNGCKNTPRIGEHSQ